MAPLVGPLQLAATGLTVLNGVQSGKFNNQLAKARAADQDRKAGQARASAQRQAAAQRRKASIARSNAVTASASAGGAADGDTANLLARIDREGAFSSKSALANGDVVAQDKEFSGRVLRATGKESQRQANVQALKDGLSFMEKFAGLYG